MGTQHRHTRPQSNNYETVLRRVSPGSLPDDAAFDLQTGRNPIAWARGEGISQAVENQAVAELLGVSIATSLRDYAPWPDFVEKTPISYCRRNGVIALRAEDGRHIVAVSNIDSCLDSFRHHQQFKHSKPSLITSATATVAAM